MTNKKFDNISIEKKNIKFFSKNTSYKKNIHEIDTYKILFDEITNHIYRSKKLLDIGHGGTFDYDTSKVEKIVGLDLDQMVISKSKLPTNISLEVGSVLDIPKNLNNFDTTLLVMLIHHLIGSNVEQNLKNLDKCLSEIRKTLTDDGKLVIVESCVPEWFYFIEKILFRPSSYLINKFLNHPPAFQFTREILYKYLQKNKYKNIKFKKIKQGKFILQYGFKFPTFLTPVETIIITANK